MLRDVAQLLLVAVRREVHSALHHLQLLLDQIHHDRIEVVAAEMRVAVRSDHRVHAILHTENRAIEGAASKVVHQDGLVASVLEAVGDGRSRRLIEDFQHVATGQRSSVDSGLALAVVEVGGDGNDDVRNAPIAEAVRNGNQVLDHEAADLFGGVLHLFLLAGHLDYGTTLLVVEVTRVTHHLHFNISANFGSVN